MAALIGILVLFRTEPVGIRQYTVWISSMPIDAAIFKKIFEEWCNLNWEKDDKME